MMGWLRASLPILVLLVALPLENKAYITSYYKPFNYTCPDGHLLKTFESNFYREDRLWHFDCYNDETVPLVNCQWSGYVNRIGHNVNYKCGYDRVIAGIASNYSSHDRDRQWEFRCCELNANFIIHACDYTGELTNATGTISYQAPTGYLVSGIYSVWDARHRDRVFQLDVCKLAQIMPVVG